MGWPGPCARGSGRAGSSLLKSWTWLARRSRRANVASAKKGVEERTMCFLLAGTRVLLLVPRYNIKMQLDSRQARPSRWLQSVAADLHRLEAAPAAWALCSGAGGARQAAAAGLRAGRWGGADSATPGPRPPARGRPGIVFQDLISRSS